MSLVSFAYVVQLDLPNCPIKVGQSCNPIARLHNFSANTPVDVRMLGATVGGKEREKAMLEATSDRILKGEWREPTEKLQQMLNSIHARGDWYSRTDDIEALWERERVIEILEAHNEWFAGRLRKASAGWMLCHPVKGAVKALQDMHPLLGLHISGFDRSDEPPALKFPEMAEAA